MRNVQFLTRHDEVLHDLSLPIKEEIDEFGRLETNGQLE
jgi:hypothetical protein